MTFGDNMDFWTAIQALILGIVEGLTEFLPISSTGHQIIVADLIGFGGERAKAFNIIIQLGAILAVVWEYRAKILEVVLTLPREPRSQRFTVNLLLAFLPAAVLGVAFSDQIHAYLFNPLAVAVALVLVAQPVQAQTTVRCKHPTQPGFYRVNGRTVGVCYVYRPAGVLP